MVEKKTVLFALGDYLDRLDMQDFDVGEHICRLREKDNYLHVPTIGFAISGGGWASALTGTGALRALDSRLEAAREQGTGDLLQSMTYLSGLSGQWVAGHVLCSTQLPYRGRDPRPVAAADQPAVCAERHAVCGHVRVHV